MVSLTINAGKTHYKSMHAFILQLRYFGGNFGARDLDVNRDAGVFLFKFHFLPDTEMSQSTSSS